jgi:hypothetical protein
MFYNDDTSSKPSRLSAASLTIQSLEKKQETYSQKIFFASLMTIRHNRLERFVLGKSFQPGIMFASEAGAHPS